MSVDELRTNASQARSVPSGRVQVYAVFDVEHDGDLYERLLANSASPGCTFEVMGGSEGASASQVGSERVRRRMRAADQVIVLCGEHAEASPHVRSELQIARDAGKPYFLLWGRRGAMCTKPVGAEPNEGMFSWTPQLLHDRIAFNLRRALSEASDQRLRRAKRSPGAGPPSAPPQRDADALPHPASPAP